MLFVHTEKTVVAHETPKNFDFKKRRIFGFFRPWNVSWFRAPRRPKNF
mgnify:CR=1 FL=1